MNASFVATDEAVVVAATIERFVAVEEDIWGHDAKLRSDPASYTDAHGGPAKRSPYYPIAPSAGPRPVERWGFEG